MYKPETIATLKKFYTENKDRIDYLSKFGQTLQKMQANYIIKIANGETQNLETISA